MRGTMMYWAVVSRASAVVNTLLRSRCDSVLPTRVRNAIVSNDRATVSSWLSRSTTQVDSRHPLHGETALMIAASRGLPDMVSFLLNANPDVNLTTEKPIDGRHFSAIMCAAASGHEDVVSLLVDAGAKVDGLPAFVDEAHSHGMLSDDKRKRLRHCCSCCTIDCPCCSSKCCGCGD